MDNNYQLSRIHNYINGLMSKEEMHALEREALNDPFLHDAIEGYALQNGVDAKQLSLLQKRLAARVEQHSVRRDQRFYGWQRLAVGATAAVMFVTVCILLLIKYMPQQKNASLTEVEILQENSYRITIEGERTSAQPLEGWTNYQHYIDQHLNNTEQREGRIHITFDVNEQGEAYNIKEQTESGTVDALAELHHLITNGPKWSGKKGDIVLDIQKAKK